MTRRAILIGGCGRSGTTVLNGLLSCHPQVHTVDIETSAFCPTAYTEDVEAGRSLEAHPRVWTVRHEDLVHDLEGELRSLCGFLNLPFDERMLSGTRRRLESPTARGGYRGCVRSRSLR